MAGSQKRRNSSPIGVPGPVRLMSSFSASVSNSGSFGLPVRPELVEGLNGLLQLPEMAVPGFGGRAVGGNGGVRQAFVHHVRLLRVEKTELDQLVGQVIDG